MRWGRILLIGVLVLDVLGVGAVVTHYRPLTRQSATPQHITASAAPTPLAALVAPTTPTILPVPTTTVIPTPPAIPRSAPTTKTTTTTTPTPTRTTPVRQTAHTRVTACPSLRWSVGWADRLTSRCSDAIKLTARSPRPGSRQLRQAERMAAVLTGVAHQPPVSWSPETGLWENHTRAYWWHSALVFNAVIRFSIATDNRRPAIQKLLIATYHDNIYRVKTGDSDFIDHYTDDTGWWAQAWLLAAQYELHVQKDPSQARAFLAVAEADAEFIAAQPHICGGAGIDWKAGYPPNTISTAEFVVLSGQLAVFLQAPGPLQDSSLADSYRVQATTTLQWLTTSGLIDPTTGVVHDSDDDTCQPINGPRDYTEAEVAEAFTIVGQATKSLTDEQTASHFFDYITNPANGLTSRSDILQEPCETTPDRCRKTPRGRDFPAYKIVVMTAITDWHQVTQSSMYNSWIDKQAGAVIKNAILNSHGHAADCRQLSGCRVSMYWSHPVIRQPMLSPTAGSEAAGLTALMASLSAPALQH